MADNSHPLLSEIEAFIAATGIGESYFGKRAVGNSELVKRLRLRRPIFPETIERVRAFMRDHPPAHGPASTPAQAPARKSRKGDAALQGGR